MRELQLSDGGVSLVDDDIYARVSSRKWCRDRHGYVRRGTFKAGQKSQVLLHRVVTEASDGEVIDHINGDKLDNRRANLRRVSWRQNAGNRSKQRSSSIYKGVTRHACGRWQATCDGSYLGLYSTEEAAAHSYDEAARQSFGAHAAVNFPGPGERSALKQGAKNL